MEVRLIQCTPNPIETISRIASICYDSDPKDPMKLVKHLYRCGHHSVFEHVYLTFYIDGISRVCSHQLVRHRHCTFTQRSQRYCDESHSAFIYPKSCFPNDAYGFVTAINREQYESMCESGIPKEDARYILPNACTTSLYMSCNFRELMHICSLRLCKRAQWEIKEVVEKMKELVPQELQQFLVPACGQPWYKCLDTSCSNNKER